MMIKLLVGKTMLLLGKVDTPECGSGVSGALTKHCVE
ncbi:Uncharacterised protein [Yersinia frederiksenii]|nr:Uncharacterised protein [Yersinia frederiksenii]CNI92456.1 Uncharacterised protein [Yersinia intermedia]CNI96451.1 Uncharacterised protein [Yersinia intermedia]